MLLKIFVCAYTWFLLHKENKGMLENLEWSGMEQSGTELKVIDAQHGRRLGRRYDLTVESHIKRMKHFG